jgi:phi LC3 family holin
MKIVERLRNKVFLTALVAFIIMVVKQFNLFEVPDNWETLLNSLLGLLIMLGIVVDPTTPGLGDGK